MDTKEILGMQEVVITVHSFIQCSGEAVYVVSPGIKGSEVRGFGMTTDEAVELEIEKRMEFYEKQGYRVRVLNHTTYVK